jgi:hypothetical protein
MVDQKTLLSKIDVWVGEGLITYEQAETLRRREAERAIEAVPARRVRTDEIFVYLGSLVVFLALAFLVKLNWQALGSTGHILSVVVPTVIMLALGGRLHRSESMRLRRGAQALWLTGCLLSALSFGVIFNELDLIADENLMILVSCLLGMGVAGVVFVLLPTVVQSIAFHLCGAATLVTFLVWLDSTFPPHNPWRIWAIGVVAGGFALVLSEWLRGRRRNDLMTVSQIFGAVAVLGFSLTQAMQPQDLWMASGQKFIMEAITFLASSAFIAASVRRQSQVFLYSGAAFLLLVITYVNFEHFADKVGMPITLLIIGGLLIGLGLGTEQLRRRIHAPT